MAKSSSPYSTTFASGHIDYQQLNPDGQMRRYKTEEKEAQAPNTLPYEMGNLPTYFGEMVSNGFEACKLIDTLLKSPKYEDAEELVKLRNNTEKMVVYLIKNVDVILEQFTIGAEHEADRKEKEQKKD